MGLSTEQLDFLLDPDSNSIGALLLHFAAVEVAYQVETFEGRELSEAELLVWRPALNLGEEGRANIHGYALDYYIDRLNEVRKRTYDLFASVDDEWLNHSDEDFWHHKPANYYFKWYHVFEDEINHRGSV